MRRDVTQRHKLAFVISSVTALIVVSGVAQATTITVDRPGAPVSGHCNLTDAVQARPRSYEQWVQCAGNPFLSGWSEQPSFHHASERLATFGKSTTSRSIETAVRGGTSRPFAAVRQGLRGTGRDRAEG